MKSTKRSLADTGDCSTWIPNFGKTPLSANANTQAQGIAQPEPIIGNEIDNGILISPNPFKDKFDIRYNTLFDKQSFSVYVYDLMGNIIYTHNSVEEMGFHNFSVPLTASASIYMAKICLGHKCITYKLIKNEDN